MFTIIKVLALLVDTGDFHQTYGLCIVISLV
jgi:hypothetical protein